jgi:septal ring-binding cell division protein DamX
LRYTLYQVYPLERTVNKTTIMRFRGFLIFNVIVFGLVACSSDPAPWTRPDETPWSQQSVADQRPSEETVIVEEEPVVMNESEMMGGTERFAEPVYIEEPVPVVAAVAVPEPDPIPMSPEAQILAMDSGYAVQIYASSTMSRVDQFKADYELDDMLAVRTDRDGSIIYVLVSPQFDRGSATTVAAELQQKTGTEPWVRAIQGLQKVVAQ